MVNQGIRTAFVGIPLTFEANHGQTHESVRFFTRAGGHAVYLTDTGPVLSSNAGDSLASVHVSFVGASPGLKIVPGDRAPGTVNYFSGNDPDAWVTGIPTYESVYYRSVYSGIDAIFYSAESGLAYDFIVSPGARPDAIRLRFDGADSLRIATDGSLLVQVSDQEMVHSPPVLYQDIDGRRVPIEGGYLIRGESEAGFWIGD